MSAQCASEDEGFGKPAGPHDESMTGAGRRSRRGPLISGSVMQVAGVI